MSKEQRIGIAVDNWKLPVFLPRLKAAGFTVIEVTPVTDGTTLLSIVTTRRDDLEKVIRRCEIAAKKAKGKQN